MARQEQGQEQGVGGGRRRTGCGRAPLVACGSGRASALPFVLDTTRRLLALDAGLGARVAVHAVDEAFRSVPQLSAGQGTPCAADGERLAALAELSEVAGWILFDAGRHRRAHRANARALSLAELCGDRWTARLTLLNHSMLQAHVDRPRAALAAASRVPGPRPLPARVGTLVLIRQAHAVAMLGGSSAATDLLAQARSRFLDGVSRTDPAWAWWIDETELLGHQGWVLARLRHWGHAVPLLHRAATATAGPAYRGLFAAHLLAAYAGAGAWRDAEQLVGELAPRIADTASARTAESLGATALRHR
ncbi:hypothetical protein, partial [Streptomyces sp. NPDC047123]|uniref:hypothetical protein n=1 Tax=Streptomyces sp. NPDC047123 TaxID=3155622 RepID=UPI0033C973C8